MNTTAVTHKGAGSRVKLPRLKVRAMIRHSSNILQWIQRPLPRTKVLDSSPNGVLSLVSSSSSTLFLLLPFPSCLPICFPASLSSAFYPSPAPFLLPFFQLIHHTFIHSHSHQYVKSFDALYVQTQTPRPPKQQSTTWLEIQTSQYAVRAGLPSHWGISSTLALFELVCSAGASTLSLPRVVNFRFPLQPRQEYYITLVWNHPRPQALFPTPPPRRVG